MSQFNTEQITCRETYSEGEFAHVETLDDCREVGDTLFLFLMIELATDEGCDSRSEGWRRVAVAIDNLIEVRDALAG